MNAVDTNVVVRYLTHDNPAQTDRATAIVDGGRVFLPVTVVVETEWVLRRLYGFGTADFTRAFRSFLALPTVSVAEADAVSAALDLCDGGMDFADALHLMLSQDCEGFVSFDRALVRGAKAAGVAGVREP